MKQNKRALLWLAILALLLVSYNLRNNSATIPAAQELPPIAGEPQDSPESGLQLLPDEPEPVSPQELPPPVEEPSAVHPESDSPTSAEEEPFYEEEKALPEDGIYDSKEDVALYLHLYGRLPSNYITKKEAEKLGWSGGKLERYAPGKCIGGSHFGNYEEILPTAKGRQYTECDIDTLGAKSRGAKRIVYSNDGLIYYTDDHYESFELLYGEP